MFYLLPFQAVSDMDIKEAYDAVRNHPTALECIAQECPDKLRKGENNASYGIILSLSAVAPQAYRRKGLAILLVGRSRIVPYPH